MSSEENIKCYLRCRPLTQSEKSLGANCVNLLPDKKTLLVDCSSENKPEKQFVMDEIFSEASTQEDIFNSLCLPMLSSFVNGYNCTIFAYGQTGAGKTHTIFGPLDALYDKENKMHGLIPRILSYLLNHETVQKEIEKEDLKSSAEQNHSDIASINYNIQCSCMEMYQEQLIDLLSDENDDSDERLIIREGKNKEIYVENLIKMKVDDEETAKDLLVQGMQNRHVASTKMNVQSSRSHLIFTLFLETTIERKNGKIVIRNSRMNLIDLAGSERQKSTGAVGERIKEAGNINKSLSILGNVINALTDSKMKFVPFRDSKLTYFLKDSLGGNSKTMIIANISQSVIQLNETLSTLNFVQRAKMIKNKTEVNENITDNEKIAILENEVKKLKELLNSKKAPQDLSRTNGNCVNELIEKLNEFLGYEEIICKKMKFLEAIGTTAIGDFMQKKEKYEKDIESFCSSSNDSKLSVVKQELELYKHIRQFYLNNKAIENSEKAFSSNFASKISLLHNEIKNYFNNFGIEDIGKKSLMLVDKNEYSKMKLKIDELTMSNEENQKKIEGLENENFLMKMEMQYGLNEEEEKDQKNDKPETTSNNISCFSNSTPKKEIKINPYTSSAKFISNLKQSIMRSSKQKGPSEDHKEVLAKISELNDINDDLIEIEDMVNTNNEKIRNLNCDYDTILEYIKTKKIFEEISQLKKERESLNLEIKLLRGDLINKYQHYAAEGIINAKKKIKSKIKDERINLQRESAQREGESAGATNSEIVNFIFENFRSKDGVQAKERSVNNAIGILKEFLEKVELQNFFLNNQFKENIAPNTPRNQGGNNKRISVTKRQNLSRLFSKSPLSKGK